MEFTVASDDSNRTRTALRTKFRPTNVRRFAGELGAWSSNYPRLPEEFLPWETVGTPYPKVIFGGIYDDGLFIY